MLSDVFILLHDNNHTARKTQELLRKFKWRVWSHTLQTRFGTQSGFQTLIWSKVPSEIDVQTVVENSLNGNGRDFCPARLTLLFLRPLE
ncbi:hypothetical protein AVEN_10315-1 [Araneus ventricosus]|uniref:Uncharacterized protein n=1 Tax=Araneus ventricosus TaxID=182803 RepID=A0A4Y2MX74_ARAVE|nr:hypothetical protein AVEN_10315-1 [Araneus ventricosus]